MLLACINSETVCPEAALSIYKQTHANKHPHLQLWVVQHLLLQRQLQLLRQGHPGLPLDGGQVSHHTIKVEHHAEGLMRMLQDHETQQAGRQAGNTYIQGRQQIVFDDTDVDMP